MELINNLKSLPKDYIKVIVLKILLALMSLIALASFLMFATVVFLYLHHYSVEAIVLGAFLVWAIFLAIIGGLYYFQWLAYRNRTELVKSLLLDTEAFITLGLSFLYKYFPKRRKKKLNQKETSAPQETE